MKEKGVKAEERGKITPHEQQRNADAVLWEGGSPWSGQQRFMLN